MSTSREETLLRLGLCFAREVARLKRPDQTDSQEARSFRFEEMRTLFFAANLAGDEMTKEAAKAIYSLLNDRLYTRLVAASTKGTALSSARAASGWVVTAREASPRGAALRFAAASETLSKENAPVAAAPEAIGVLESEIAKTWATFVLENFLFVDDDAMREAYENGPPEDECGFSWDMALCRLLEKTGVDGQKKAEKIRANSRERLAMFKAQEASAPELFSRWLPKETSPAFPALVILGQALWRDIVRPRLERAAHKHPALPRLVHSPVTSLLSAPKVREEGGQMALDLGLPAPCIIREVADLPSAARGIELFKSIHAHRVLWHIVRVAHERAAAIPGWSPHLEYEGGYAALAEACGIGGRDGAVKVRELVELFSVLDLTLPGYQGGLLTRTFIEAKGQRRAFLKIIPGTPLLPGYVFELQRVTGTASPTARREQDLIPLLPVPPVLGRANDAGAQATLQLRVMAHLRDHAADLAGGRGAPLPLDTWARLAAESHVPRSLTPKLLPHWQEDHQDGPAVLKRVDRDRYTLGDAHAAARAFLEDGGRRSLDSSEAGRRSAAKRAAARSKVGQK